MRSSHLSGNNGRLLGSSFLTFVSLLVVMFASPVFGKANYEGKTLYTFRKAGSEWKDVNQKHATDEQRKKFADLAAKAADKVTDDDVKNAFKAFASTKSGNQFVALTESIVDAMVTVAKDSSPAKVEEFAKKLTDTLSSKADDFGKNWLKDREEEKSINNSEGFSKLVNEAVRLLKEKGADLTDENIKAVMKELMENEELLASLGISKDKLKKDSEEAKENEKKEAEKKEAEKKENEKKENEKKENEKKENEKKANEAKPVVTPQPAGPTPGTPPAGPEQAGVNCAQQPANNGALDKFLQDMLGNLAKLQRQQDPGNELQDLANALGRRPEQNGQGAQQPQSQPLAQSNPNDQRRDDPNNQENLGKDQQPQQQPDPSFADAGVPPIFLNGGVRKPEYRKTAEDGSKEKAELSGDVAMAKSLDKRGDTFLKTGIPALTQNIMLPNGQVNPFAYANAKGSIQSMAAKFRTMANNLSTSVEWGKARLDALAKEIKKASPELARLEDADKTLKELTGAEQTLQQALQTKSSQCGRAQLPQEKQDCEAAKQNITNSLQQLKTKKTEQQDLIAKGDKGFEEGYAAELKETKTQLEAEVKSAEKQMSAMEEKADQFETQATALDGQLASAMAPAAPQGNTTAAKLTAGNRRSPSAFGGVMGAGANTLAGGAGVGRGTYAPGSKGL